jgi:hypothetical protein
MSRSTYTMEHFNYERESLKIGRGLQSIGDTRFGTVHWAAESLRRCLPALRNIVGDETLDIDINVRQPSPVTQTSANDHIGSE